MKFAEFQAGKAVQAEYLWKDDFFHPYQYSVIIIRTIHDSLKVEIN